MADHITRRGNLIIWQLNQDHRRVWEMSPFEDDVIAYREEHYKLWYGRYQWISRAETSWSNPAFFGLDLWGLMTECPKAPEVPNA